MKILIALLTYVVVQHFQSAFMHIISVILGTTLEGGEVGITDTVKKKQTRFDDLP